MALATALLPAATASTPADDRAAARMGIQLRVMPDCTARPDGEGCLQPALRTPDGSSPPEQISGLSPAPAPASSENDAAPVITRTW